MFFNAVLIESLNVISIVECEKKPFIRCIKSICPRYACSYNLLLHCQSGQV